MTNPLDLQYMEHLVAVARQYLGNEVGSQPTTPISPTTPTTPTTHTTISPPPTLLTILYQIV